MSICINCMQTELNEEGICPICHKSDADIETKKRFLPFRHELHNRYLVGKHIGKGGFANTYIAYDKDLEIRIAIKEFFPRDDVERDDDGITVVPSGSDSVEYVKIQSAKFIDEARRLTKFRKEDGIATVYDIFSENGTAYIVMDYIDGVTLRDYLNETHRQFTFDEALQLLYPMLVTLNKMHKTGIVHRDISPDNIMVSRDLKKIFLIDFGSAREANPIEGRRTMSMSYKVSYSPLEQTASDEPQGPWSDIYAICATIYRCITGKIPTGVLDRLGVDKLKKPSEFDAIISPLQEQALLDGMTVDVESRIKSVDELLARFGNIKPPINLNATEEKIHKVKEFEAEAFVTLPPYWFEKRNIKDDEFEIDTNVTLAPRWWKQ